MSEQSAKPYLVRAICEWCADNGLTPYLAVKVNGQTRVPMSFVKNGHPMVPLSTLTAGHRLMMHGLDCEAFHGWLRLLKHRQAMGLSLDPRNPIGATPA